MNEQHAAPAAARARAMPWLSALFLVAATACGGGGGDDPAPAPAPTPAPAPGVPTIAPAVNLDANQQIGVTSTFWGDGSTATGGAGATVQGVPCAAPVDTFHIHSHLSIIVNGQAQAIAANVGLVDTATLDCHYYVHTHDRSGKVHVEAPAAGTFTLGQFFAIWGQPLTSTNVAGITNMDRKVYITENSTVTEFTGDPATIELQSHRHIAIVLGTPVTQVPFFTWTAN
jgi:hypothetical protein